MMIGAGGAGKTSLRHGLMKKPLPKMAFSTFLANSMSVKCQWAGASCERWVEIDEKDEINELATLLSRIIENNFLLQSAESASAIKDFQPFAQPQSEGPQSASDSSSDQSDIIEKTPEKVFTKGRLARSTQPQQESTNISSRDHSDIVDKIREKVFAKVRRAKISHQPHSEVLLNVWDSGGQVVFMNVLPAFLTKRTLFMLVFDASKNLEMKLQFEAIRAGEVVHIEQYHLNSTELLLQWMASIDAHLSLRKPGTTVDSYPRIMLVGTHLDQLVSKGCNPARTILESLHLQYKDKTYADLLLPSPGYIVDNTTAGQDKEDPAFQTIRKCVHDFTATNFTVSTPITWVLFRKVMQTISQANKPIMRYSEVIAVAEACWIPTIAVPSVLNFYHELGVFLYYSKIQSLREVIIATPQWLVNHIAKLLTPHGLEDQGRERHWRLLRKKGILTETLYTEILKDSVVKPQAVVDLLEYSLLAVPIKTTRIHPYIGKEYFVPCMLDAPSESVPCHPPSQQSTDVHIAEPMHLIFSTHYVPPGFYVRLVATIAKHEDCNIIFQQSSRYAVTFDYQEVDEITVREHPDSIEVQVTRTAQGGPQVPPFHRVCRDILQFMNNSVQVVNIWLPSVSVNTAFICSSCSLDLPRHFVTFHQDAFTTTTVRCQGNERQQLGQLQSQQCWLNMRETASSQVRHSGTIKLPPQQQHKDELQIRHPPPASQAMKSWEHQAMSNNSSAIISALADNSLANILADELKSRKLIGAAVHAKATSNDPDTTEYWRVKQIITAMLSKIEHNPQRYYDFIYVLKLDHICVDAEAALALLPTGVPSTREQMNMSEPVYSLKATTQMEPENYQGHTMQGTTKKARVSSRITDVKLGDFLEHVTTPRWFDLGLAVGVDDSTLRFIEYDTRGDSHTGLRRMFQEWLDSCEQPSWDNVIQALRKIGENRLATEICQKL